MTEIKIPFLHQFKKQLQDGDKVATTRTKRYGQKGDTFTIFDTRFKIVQIIPTPLSIIAEFFYKPEGFHTPEQFIECWKQIHPRKGYVPDQKVYLHIFCRLGENSNPSCRSPHLPPSEKKMGFLSRKGD